jgi:hypothetical protein
LRRIVGVDHDDGARGGGDDVLEMIEVRLPSVRRIRAVEPRASAELGKHCGVQRVSWQGHEHFALVVDECAQRQFDRFRRAGCDQHAVGGDGP